MKRSGRFLGNLLAMALAVVSLQAVAATELGGRDFNHMTTGFPLSGGHATAACETCHVGGVFKGTPKNCDGCHALGKRIVATPKSNNHIVTDAPCESCHFNTSTFLGARYNHATAVPGQCVNCHNGRTAQGRTNSVRHSSTLGQRTCDTCHRTSTWMIAGWNHTGAEYVGQSCDSSLCHSGTGMASAKTVQSNPKHLPYPSVSTVTFASCQTCHLSYGSFSVVRFNHPSGLNCSDCHNTTYNLGAVRAMPSNHIPLLSVSNCQACHTSGSSWGGMQHSQVTTVCKTCHNSSPVYLGKMTRKTLGSHERSNTGQDCTSCHALQYNRWNNP